MELKRLFPDAAVFNFYMDIRMFGPGYEEMYREAQQNYNIHFVRGRISEASPTRRPVADQGRRYPDGASFADERRYAGAARRDAGERFERRFRGFGRVEAGAQRLHGTAGPLLEQRPQRCGRDLYAGTVTAPKNIGETLNEADAAVEALTAYLGRV